MKTLSVVLALLGWLLHCMTPVVGYLTPTGHLCFHQSAALRRYLDRADSVFLAARDWCIWGRGSQSFREEWEALLDLRRNCQDYQLLEFVAEPSHFNRQLANLELDIIPALLRGKKEGLQRFLRRECHRGVNLKGVPSWRRGDLETRLSPELMQDYRQLIESHVDLIEAGADFGGQDRIGKQKFLTALKKVEDRWDILYHRCRLLGILNPDYVEATAAYLASLGMTERKYRWLRQNNRRKLLEDGQPIRYLVPDRIRPPKTDVLLAGMQRLAVGSVERGRVALRVGRKLLLGRLRTAWKKRRRVSQNDCFDEPFM